MHTSSNSKHSANNLSRCLKIGRDVDVAMFGSNRDCNSLIPDPGIPDRFSIPKSRDYERPNPGISGFKKNDVLTLLLRVKCEITK